MTYDEISHHHGSHRDLLELPVDPSPIPRDVDAVIVPTARRPAYLTESVGLARALGCALVTLHSGKWTTAAEAAERFGAGVYLIAIDVPKADGLHLPDWETSRLLAGTVFARRADLSLKRNLALMLCHMVGWSRILFLDDDITGLNPDDVRKASGLLDTYNYNAVGLQIGGFPDHSVVCHAYRQAGGKQQSFIGGGALAVALERSTSFFPDIYNDDWFFLLDGNERLQPTSVTGRVFQYPYDPFRSPERARAEELGDVLAEGIYWLLDQDLSIADADRGHWARFLESRARFIQDVLAMVRADDALESHEKDRRVAALKGSLGRLTLITPRLCDSYLQAWAADQRQWQRYVGRLPTRQRLPGALAALSRPGGPPLTWQPGAKDGRSTAGIRLKPYRPLVPESPEGAGAVAVGVDRLVSAAPDRGDSLAQEPP